MFQGPFLGCYCLKLVIDARLGGRHVSGEPVPHFREGTSSRQSDELHMKHNYYMINIYKELSYRDEASFAAVESLLLTFEHEPIEEPLLTKHPAWVEIVKNHILTNWNKPISLEQLAEMCSVHRVTISKNFAKYVGSTVMIYQRKIRMIRAIELMQENKYSLTEIAFLCGFSDQSHFTRYFRQMTGYIPKHLPKIIG